MTLGDIREMVAAIDPTSGHYESEHRDGDPYTVWHEKRTLPFMGDGAHEGGIKFQIDRFTKAENDSIAAGLYAALEARDNVAFEYLTDYEPDTGYIHHIFDCEGI